MDICLQKAAFGLRCYYAIDLSKDIPIARFMKMRITSGNIQAVVQLLDTDTARSIYRSLPVESRAHRWGDEIYFSIPIELELEGGKEVLDVGDVAYWPPGSSICIFFGPTPVSSGGEPKAYSPVSVFGKVVGDAAIFKTVQEGDAISIESVD